jgi:cytosine/uracil/thiamine/allantoin permease
MDTLKIFETLGMTYRNPSNILSIIALIILVFHAFVISVFYSCGCIILQNEGSINIIQLVTTFDAGLLIFFTVIFFVSNKQQSNIPKESLKEINNMGDEE